MDILFVSVPSSELRMLLPRFMTRAGTFWVAGSLYFFLLCAFSSCWLSGFQNCTAEWSLVFFGALPGWCLASCCRFVNQKLMPWHESKEAHPACHLGKKTGEKPSGWQ